MNPSPIPCFIGIFLRYSALISSPHFAGFRRCVTLTLSLILQESVDLGDCAVESNNGEAVISSVENQVLAHDGQANEAEITTGKMSGQLRRRSSGTNIDAGQAAGGPSASVCFTIVHEKRGRGCLKQEKEKGNDIFWKQQTAIPSTERSTVETLRGLLKQMQLGALRGADARKRGRSPGEEQFGGVTYTAWSAIMSE